MKKVTVLFYIGIALFSAGAQAIKFSEMSRAEQKAYRQWYKARMKARRSNGPFGQRLLIQQQSRKQHRCDSK